MKLTDETKKAIDFHRENWRGNTSAGGQAVSELLAIIDALTRRLDESHDEGKRLRAAITTAKEEARQEEMEWRFQNGVHFSAIPLPGDVCGQNRCMGVLRAGDEPYYVWCDKCRVRVGPGPGAFEAMEAAEQLGRRKLQDEMHASMANFMQKISVFDDAQIAEMRRRRQTEAEALPEQDRYLDTNR